MIIAACNCGAAITGEDRATVTGAVSAHLRQSLSPMTVTLAPGDHFALIGEADAKIALTTTETPVTGEAP